MRPQFGASPAGLSSVTSHRSRLASTISAVVLSVMAAVAGSGCEELAIGRTCESYAAMPSATNGTWHDEALECPTRLCLKPAYGPQAIEAVMTAPFCTAECSSNSDCEDAERRGKTPEDRRCTKKFVCATPFETGALKCKKLCVCGDFYSDLKTATEAPAACAK